MGTTKTDITLHPTGGYPICGSALRKKPGEICKLKAGIRTTHRGIGRCYLHGGTTETPTSLVKKYGIQAHITLPQVSELVEKLSQDREVYNFREHIYILEALAVTLINNQDLVQGAKIMTEITKALQRLHEVEVGRRYVVTVVDVRAIMDRVVEIIDRYVPDEYTRELIGGEMRRIRLNTPETSSNRMLPSKSAEIIEAEYQEA